ncbi:MAG: sortase, partial [Actinomycetota bacterium]|nr:sortase [Actinomycetota bacterium]
MQSTKLENVFRRTGLVLIGSGALLFLFALYQLFGTALITAQAQNGLESDLDTVTEELASDEFFQNTFTKLETITVSEDIERTETVETEVSSSPFENLTAEEISALGTIVYKPQGEAIAQIIAPAMGLDSIVVSGTAVSALRKGPGHYADSAALCSTGNAAIAGHRTTYGAPFGDIANLKFGDEIRVNTPYGNCIYMVTERFVVDPSDTWVVKDQGDNRLTLTSCHPKYSAAQRYIVVAELTQTNVPYLPSQEEINDLIVSTTETTVVSEEVTTTETVDREVEVATEVTNTVRSEVHAAIETTNSVTEGFGEGLDGDDGQLLAVILYGLVFFALWYR